MTNIELKSADGHEPCAYVARLASARGCEAGLRTQDFLNGQLPC